jgi:predicted glycosyltransferase involved in capsule biosynthesis
MKLILITLFLTAMISVNSQHAENLFKDYYLRFGLDLSYREMFAKNIGYDEYMWHSVKMGGFGIQYNFYQKENLNFRITPQYHFGVFHGRVCLL